MQYYTVVKTNELATCKNMKEFCDKMLRTNESPKIAYSMIYFFYEIKQILKIFTVSEVINKPKETPGFNFDM